MDIQSKSKLILLSILFFLGWSCNRDNDENAKFLNQWMTNYLTLNNQKNFDSIAELVYQPVIEFNGGKKEFLANMQFFLDNSDFNYELIGNTSSINIEPIKKFRNDSVSGYYSIGHYMVDQTFSFKDSTGDIFSNYSQNIDKITLVGASVKKDSLNNKIHIQEPKYFILIKDQKPNSRWGIINYVPTPEIENFFPPRALIDLKRKYKLYPIGMQSKYSNEP